MNKKHSLAYFALLIIGLISSLTINLAAQNRVAADSKQEQKPIVADRILQNYIDISSLPTNKRPATFSKLAAEDKANLFKLHLALQLVKRPNLNKEQKDLLSDSISMITSESYNLENAQARSKAQQDARVLDTKAKTLFPMRETFEIFASLGGNQEDIDLLQKYQYISNLPSMNERKELFAKSSSMEKSNYWKIHFAYSLVKFSELNKEQKEIIIDLMSLLKPELYDAEKNSDQWQTEVEKPIQSISNRALKSFSKEVGLNIFLKLGGEAPTESLASECDCALNSIPSCWDEICQGWSCHKSSSGCGVIWLSECNGRCPAR